MKKFWILFGALVLGGFLAGQGVMAQLKWPSDFQFEKGKGSPGPVTYSHASHIKRESKCTICHNKIFKMKKGSAKIVMAGMYKGDACGTCHNGTLAFATNSQADCLRCHSTGTKAGP